MQPSIFLTPIFRGARFDGHAMPVVVLSELAAYQRLVIAVAKAVYKSKRPGRQRVPKGFEDQFQLQLRTVEPGSAAPLLERQLAADEAPQLSFPEYGDPFEQARDLIGAAIEATSENRPLPEGFPLDALHLFNTFGKSLKEGESVALKVPERDASPVYNRSIRKRLILLREHYYEDDVQLVGNVVQFDNKRTIITIEDGNHLIPCPVTETIRPLLQAALFQDEQLIQVTGTGQYDARDVLVRILSVEDASLHEDEDLAAQLDIEKQLRALASLDDGWLDGAGKEIAEDDLHWLAGVLKHAVTVEGLQKPYLYPTPDGGVQAEWSFPDAEVSAEIDLKTHQCELHGVHVRSQATRDEKADLQQETGVVRLVEFVNGFANAGSIG